MVAQNLLSFSGFSFAQPTKRSTPPNFSAASAMTDFAAAVTLFGIPLRLPPFRFASCVADCLRFGFGSSLCRELVIPKSHFRSLRSFSFPARTGQTQRRCRQ